MAAAAIVPLAIVAVAALALVLAAAQQSTTRAPSKGPDIEGALEDVKEFTDDVINTVTAPIRECNEKLKIAGLIAAGAIIAMMSSGTDSTDATSDEADSDADTGTTALGPGTLTDEELRELQEISDKFKTPIDVIGSRAEGKGRNIEQTDLPVGKGEGTRSDIDVRIDGQTDIDSRGQLSDAVSNVGNGAGSPLIHTGVDPSPPVIQIRPNQPPRIVSE